MKSVIKTKTSYLETCAAYATLNKLRYTHFAGLCVRILTKILKAFRLSIAMEMQSAMKTTTTVTTTPRNTTSRTINAATTTPTPSWPQTFAVSASSTTLDSQQSLMSWPPSIFQSAMRVRLPHAPGTTSMTPTFCPRNIIWFSQS